MDELAAVNQLQSVDPGHAVIADEQARLRLGGFQRCQRQHGIREDAGLIPRPPEEHLDHVTQFRIVIDDKNQGRRLSFRQPLFLFWFIHNSAHHFTLLP